MATPIEHAVVLDDEFEEPSVSLEQQPRRQCRICLDDDPLDDLIRPCRCCSAHRTCLDRWRTLSPHPDSLEACEVCKQKYELIYLTNEAGCQSKAKFGLFFTLDLLFFMALFGGLWVGCGYLGDLALNDWVKNLLNCSSGGSDCTLFHFLEYPLFSGRIWFWGFIWLFFVLGIVGCCFFCCGRLSKDREPEEEEYGDCYWVCCGPTYYNGTYYSSPYGYWNTYDLLCCWYCCNVSTPYHHHHYGGSGCDCNCDSCSGSPGNCSGGSDDGVHVLLIILLIIVIIFVVCGVIFATFLSIMIVSKIIKRHMHLLERKEFVSAVKVADLDKPDEVKLAEEQKNGNPDRYTTTNLVKENKPLLINEDQTGTKITKVEV